MAPRFATGQLSNSCRPPQSACAKVLQKCYIGVAPVAEVWLGSTPLHGSRTRGLSHLEDPRHKGIPPISPPSGTIQLDNLLLGVISRQVHVWLQLVGWEGKSMQGVKIAEVGSSRSLWTANRRLCALEGGYNAHRRTWETVPAGVMGLATATTPSPARPALLLAAEESCRPGLRRPPPGF